MGLTYIDIPQLTQQLPNGVHNCTIKDVYVVKKQDGEYLSINGDICVVVVFACGELIQEVGFKLGVVKDYTKYLKLLSIIGIDIQKFTVYKDKSIGKQVAVFVTKMFTDVNNFKYETTNFKPVKKDGKQYSFQSIQYL